MPVGQNTDIKGTRPFTTLLSLDFADKCGLVREKGAVSQHLLSINDANS